MIIGRMRLMSFKPSSVVHDRDKIVDKIVIKILKFINKIVIKKLKF